MGQDYINQGQSNTLLDPLQILFGGYSRTYFELKTQTRKFKNIALNKNTYDTKYET
jgi:hypothetical protein